MLAWAARIGSRGSFIGRVLDRIARGRLEAEHVEALLHVLGQRRGHVDDSAARMRQDEPPREQMQFWLDPWRDSAQGIAAGRVVGGFAVVFRVPDDRMADRLAMRPEL